MRRRVFVGGCAGALASLAWPIASDGQPRSTSLRRIGVLTAFDAGDPEGQVRLGVFRLAINRTAALAAQRATKTIPVVFVAVADPVGSQLVASLARPGGNITGLSNMALDLTAKRLEFLTLVVPGLRRIALIVNGNDTGWARRYIEECGPAAERLKIALHPVEIRAPGDLQPAFSAIPSLTPIYPCRAPPVSPIPWYKQPAATVPSVPVTT